MAGNGVWCLNPQAKLALSPLLRPTRIHPAKCATSITAVPAPAPHTCVHHGWHLGQACHVLQCQVLEVGLPNLHRAGRAGQQPSECHDQASAVQRSKASGGW